MVLPAWQGLYDFSQRAVDGGVAAAAELGAHPFECGLQALGIPAFDEGGHGLIMLTSSRRFVGPPTPRRRAGSPIGDVRSVRLSGRSGVQAVHR